MLYYEILQLRSRQECICLFVIHSFSYGAVSCRMWIGKGPFLLGPLRSFSSFLWGMIRFLELFGIFFNCLFGLVDFFFCMNIKYRQNLWFLPYSVVSDILAFTICIKRNTLIFVFGLNYL